MGEYHQSFITNNKGNKICGETLLHSFYYLIHTEKQYIIKLRNHISLIKMSQTSGASERRTVNKEDEQNMSLTKLKEHCLNLTPTSEDLTNVSSTQDLTLSYCNGSN